MAIAHVNDTLDLYAGIDTGVNTSLGDGDNNSSAAFQGGFGLNGLLDGKLTVLALTHIGPENVNDNRNFRYLNDILFTYKATDALTFTTELNYIKEDSVDADGYGIAQYVSYALDDVTTLNARVEVWDDAKNFFVAAFPGNRTFVQFERGLALDQPPIFSSAAATYGEITLGATLKPPVAGLQSLAIRPEIRFDDALNGVKAYNDDKSTSQFTFGLDLILKI